MPLTRESDAPRGLWRWLAALGWLVGAVARTVGRVLAWGLLLLAGVLWWQSRPAALQERTVLVIAPQGPLVEQAAGSPGDRVLSRLQGRAEQPLALPQLIAVLDHAAKDPSVSSVLLRLDGLSGGGLVLQREAAAALQRFRASGKKVVAWAQDYDQRGFYVAAHADEVYLSPMGSVQLTGFGRWRNYYRDAFERVGLQVQLVRAGAFKNAAEPFVSSGPSEQTQASDAALQTALWRLYQAGIEKARRLPEGRLDALIESLPDSLAALGGDPARWALDHKLVDGLMTPDALRNLLIDRGVRDEALKSFRQVDFGTYLSQLPPPGRGDGVAVVVAEGEIGEGAPVDAAVAERLRRARDDERAKAVVLRVNSPGGSPAVSERIRRELQLTRAAGKPVVISMGDVAASGGYWIAMAADEVLADSGTITGSIGVFGLLPSAAGLMDKLSVRSAGSGTTWLTHAADPRRPPDPRYLRLVQAEIDHLYADFVARAAAARKLTRERLEAVAQGQVWTGEQARGHGLVDRIGLYPDALAAARARAKLPADAPVLSLQPPTGLWERALQWVGTQLADAAVSLLVLGGFDRALAEPLAGPLAGPAWPAGSVAAGAALTGPDRAEGRWLLRRLAADASPVDASARPGAALVHCLCGAWP
jgi:protease-4